MQKVSVDGGIITYRDENGNELRVWGEDKKILGADFKGVEYAVAGAGVMNNY